MPRATLKSQVAELTTQVGVLMSQLQAAQSEVDSLKTQFTQVTEERDALESRCDKLEEIIAASPKRQAPPSNPKPAPKPQVPVSEIESQPVVQVTDADRRIWSAFKALPREKRQSYYDFAHATVGHLGIDREAYLAKQAA